MIRAVSLSRYAAELLDGPRRFGRAVGHGYLLFDEDVVAVTPPGALRMPNGIEASLELRAGDPASIGGGLLEAPDGAVFSTERIWNARPHPRYALSVDPRPELDVDALIGRGPGLTPFGDDVLVGFFAAAALAGRAPTSAAAAAALRTTALSGTLLRLAAEGELPEAAHRLLEDGDPEALLRFGRTSGHGIALGLAMGTDEAGPVVRKLPIEVGRRRFELAIAVAPRGRHTTNAMVADICED